MKPEPLNIILSWLQLQCQVLDGSIRAVVLLGESDKGPFRPVALWPDRGAATPALTTAATRAIRQRETVLLAQQRAPAAARQTGDIVACPIIHDDRVLGVVAVELGSRAAPQQQAAARALETNTAALELLMRSGHTESASEPHAQRLVELVAASIEHPAFDAAARSATSRCAALGQFAQVSLGIVQRGGCEVAAASGRATVDARMQAGLSMGRAMDEAIEHDATLVIAGKPSRTDATLTAHAQLAELRGGDAICTIPVTHDGSLVGAMTFEHHDPEHFDADTIAFCEAAVALIGPILFEKHQQDRSGLAKFRGAAGDATNDLFARGNRWRGVFTMAIATMLAVPFFATGEYRITADASLEGAVQRIVAAPVDGYIAAAPARAGDIVTVGQLLVRLDDRDLKLERLRLASERNQRQREHREAIAEHDNSRVTILKAQLDRATAQLALTEERLARANIVAPMAGIVVSGDLSQSLGAPVEKGQQLFEVAPLNSYRVMLRVDERDIGELHSGQTGRLALVGFPDRHLPLRVERITPVSTQADGGNFFAVEARLEDAPELLRPGMGGVGKIDVGSRQLAWIWTHRLLDWLRLRVWTWTG
jgi:RND family efflux transporter MFP subunit